MTSNAQTVTTPEGIVGETLERYAQRGVFRAYSPGPARRGKATYKMLWHHEMPFELQLDSAKGTLRFAHILPNVPADSLLYKEFKAMVKSCQADTVPEHRRIDTRRAELRAFNRNGNVSLTLVTHDADYEYATRKLVHFVQELFIAFLRDAHYEYLVENFDLDPDQY